MIRTLSVGGINKNLRTNNEQSYDSGVKNNLTMNENQSMQVKTLHVLAA